MKPMLTISDLSFKYSDNYVLQGVNLVINSGDYVGLIGANGSGKTTLLKLILGLIKPTSGEIKLSIDRNSIGYVPQRSNSATLHFPLTCFETVHMANRSASVSATQDALRLVGLNDHATKRLTHLSGGQIQRAFIARALVNSPKLLILDEPTTNIDTSSQENFFALLKRLHKDQNLTIVIVSHDLESLSTNVAKVACLDKNIIYYGAPDLHLVHHH
jgi:zinc transport system ATP-binding protein